MLDVIGLDYLLFGLICVAATGGLHIWLLRRRHVKRPPVLLWVLGTSALLPGAWLVNCEEGEVYDQVMSIVNGLSPTYAEELRILGQARITPNTSPDDPAYLAMVAAEVRWRRLRIIAVLAVMEASLITFSCLILVLRASIAERRRAQNKLRMFQRCLKRQVEERSKALVEAQRQAMQSEKLASLGQLAAGVAHEINTPIQYVGDNLRALADFVHDLVGLTDEYRELVRLVREGGPAGDFVRRVEQAEANADLAYIREDAPKAVAQGLEGVQRVAHIVRAMKDFSHLNGDQVTLLEVNAVLARALTLSRNEYRYVADAVTDFSDIPAIEGYGAELSQVFLNLIVNAGHAIGDTGQRGTITVRTRRQGDYVEVAISDTGAGIPPEIRGRVFDPFFTTKPVGKGTGQGLTIVHQIVQKHQGTIRFESQVGQGTTFYVRLPLRQKAAPKEAATVAIDDTGG